VGEQHFQNIRFNVIDPVKNGRRAVIGVSTLKGFPVDMEVPVNDTAATVYLLHSSSDNIPANVAGAITFKYGDGTFASQYIMKGKDVTNWWFSALENNHAGVAWWGPNVVSTKVGICWAAINNPFPAKKISSLVFHAPLEGGIYTIIGITLADREHYIRPTVESYGGPDNWAAANAMAALVEGLAGVKNDEVVYNRVTLSPRWPSAGIDSVAVTVRYAASDGYVSYYYIHHIAEKTINFKITGSGEMVRAHVLLPSENKLVKGVLVNGIPVKFSTSVIEKSHYVDFELTLPVIQDVIIQYS
jgi:hypothetical protein